MPVAPMESMSSQLCTAIRPRQDSSLALTSHRSGRAAQNDKS
jgi:hypothetical protein